MDATVDVRLREHDRGKADEDRQKLAAILMGMSDGNDSDGDGLDRSQAEVW